MQEITMPVFSLCGNPKKLTAFHLLSRRCTAKAKHNLHPVFGINLKGFPPCTAAEHFIHHIKYDAAGCIHHLSKHCKFKQGAVR